MWTSYVILILSIIWLLTRTLKLINLPIDKGIRSLNVFVPKVPVLSTDRITQDSVIIHWDNKNGTSSSNTKFADGDETDHKEGGPRLIVNTSPKAVSFYQLYVNGKLVNTLESAVNMCKLSNLKPGTRYQLDLIAFSTLNFRSRSSPIFVKTIETPYQKIDDADDLLKFLVPKQDIESLKIHSTFRQNRTNIYSGMPVLEAKVRDDVDQITDIEELRYLLEAGQEDLRSLLFQQTQCAKDFEEKEVILQSSRDDLRKRKKMEDLNRNSVKAELNALEESKKDIVTKIVNNQCLLDEKMRSMKKMRDEIESWNNNLQSHRIHCEELEADEKKIVNDLDRKIEDKKGEIKALKLEIDVLDAELQRSIDSKMEKDNLQTEVISLLDSLKTHTDSQTGIFDKNGISTLARLKHIRPQWGKLIEAQQSLDIETDSNWKTLEKTELQKLHSIKVQYQSLLSDNQTLQELLAGERNVLTLPRNQANVVESFQSLESNRPSVPLFASQMEPSTGSFHIAFFEPENVEDLSPNVEMLLPQSLIESEDLTLNNLKSSTADLGKYIFSDRPSTPILKEASYEHSSFDNTGLAGRNSFSSPFEFNSLHERSLSGGDGASLLFQKSPPLSHASLVEPQRLDEQISTFSPKRLSNVFNFGKKSSATNNNNIALTPNADSDYNTNHTVSSSKFFGIIKRNTGNNIAINNRTRSGSLGSSIWSNNNPNNTSTQTGEFRVGSWSNNNYGGFLTPQQNTTAEYRSPSESLIPLSLPQIDIEKLRYEDEDLFQSISHTTSDLEQQDSHVHSLGESALEKKSKRDSGGSPPIFRKRMFSLSSSPSKLDGDHMDESQHGNSGPSKSSKFFSKISRRGSTVTTSSESKVSQNSQETTGNGAYTSDASPLSGSALSGTNSSKFSRRLGFLKKDRGKEGTEKSKTKKKQKETGKDKDGDLLDSTIDEVSDESEKHSPPPE